MIIIFVMLAASVPIVVVPVAPEMRLEGRMADGTPAEGVSVTRVTQHLSFESREYSEESVADKNGVIKFPKRSIRITLLRYVFGCIGDWIAKLNPHVNTGTYIYLTSADFVIEASDYRGNGPPPNSFKVKRSKH